MTTLTHWQQARHKLERTITRPVRNLVFRRFWKRDLPVAMITGSHGKTTTSRMLANILTHAGHTVGLACTEGSFVDGVTRRKVPQAGYYGARRVLNDKTVTAAVLETTLGSLVHFGMYINQCNVAALLNILPQHLGVGSHHTLDDLLTTKRRVPDAAKDAIILNAQDERCIRLAHEYDPEKLTLFSLDPDNDDLHRFIGLGAKAITQSQDNTRLLLMQPEKSTTEIAEIKKIPATSDGLFEPNVANAMAAAGLAFALGTSLSAIRDGLHSTDDYVENYPARFNLVNDYPFQLAFDKASGPGSLPVVMATLSKLNVTGKRYALLAGAGDRPVDIFDQMAPLVAGRFDRYICFEDGFLRRGKAQGVVSGLYARALVTAGVDEAHVTQASSSLAAALAQLEPHLAEGDLVFIQNVYGEHIAALEPVLKQIADAITSSNK